MQDHVDVVKNEWRAGYHVLIARLAIKDGAIQVYDSPEPDRWSQALLQPRGGLDPVEQPSEFLAELHQHLQGTYLLATPLHDAHDACSFADTPMRALERPAEHPHAVGA